jgi:hypothetical protein
MDKVAKLPTNQRRELFTEATARMNLSSDWVEFLRKDYEKMNVMFFGEVPSFDDILSGLAELEKNIRKMVPLELSWYAETIE